MGTQTDVHILEHNLVKDYEWNEWELRRKAIKMVNDFVSQMFLKFTCINNRQNKSVNKNLNRVQ